MACVTLLVKLIARTVTATMDFLAVIAVPSDVVLDNKRPLRFFREMQFLARKRQRRLLSFVLEIP